MNGVSGKTINPVIKARAIEQVRNGESVAIIASRQGVSQSVLRNWLKEAGVIAKKAPPKKAPQPSTKSRFDRIEF